MKTKIFQIRISEQEDDELSDAAKLAKVSKSALGRTFLHEGLAGYDRKHEDFVQRVKNLEETSLRVQELVALVAALVAALDIPRKQNDRILELSADLKQAGSMVEGVLEGQRRGLFKS